MAICVPAHKDCEECKGKGQTVRADGSTKACETCWHRNIAKMVKLAMPEIRKNLRAYFCDA